MEEKTKQKIEDQKEPCEACDEVQEASEESFPASDPPSFNPVTSVGAKAKKKQDERATAGAKDKS